MPIEEVYIEPEYDPEKEEICDDCRGEGRVVWGHVFCGPPNYHDCWTCQGSGKTIKRPKCVVADCKEKQHFSYNEEVKQVLDKNGLCLDHTSKLQSLEWNLGNAERQINEAEQQLAKAKIMRSETLDKIKTFRPNAPPADAEVESMKEALKRLQAWKNRAKAHSVMIHIDDGYGAHCWVVELHNKHGKPLLFSELNIGDPESDDWDWPGLEATIHGAIDRWEKENAAANPS